MLNRSVKVLNLQHQLLCTTCLFGIASYIDSCFDWRNIINNIGSVIAISKDLAHKSGNSLSKVRMFIFLFPLKSSCSYLMLQYFLMWQMWIYAYIPITTIILLAANLDLIFLFYIYLFVSRKHLIFLEWLQKKELFLIFS